MSDDAILDPFAMDCEQDGPLRLAVVGPGIAGVAMHDLPGPAAVIGRSSSMDLMLDHPEVSRRHAYLQVFAGRVFAVSLAARSPISWGEEPRLAGWINRGEAIRVGPFTLRVDLGPSAISAETPPTSRGFSWPSSTELALDFAGPDPNPGIWQVSRNLVLLGRTPGCRIHLPGPGVAPVHAAIVRTPGGAWLVDLRRKGDVRFNGRDSAFTRLGDGEMQVGPHRIGVRLGFHTTNSGENTMMTRNAPTRDAAADPALAAVIDGFARMQDQMADQFQQALMSMFRHFTGMHQEQMGLIREELARLHELTNEQQTLQARLASGGPPRLPADRRPNLRLVAPDTPGSEPPPNVEPVRNTPIPRYEHNEPSADPHLVLMQRITALNDERQGRWQKLFGSLMGKAPDPPKP